MQAHETELGFLQKDMRLEIPYFQRPYVWVEKNWEDLFENLIDEKQSHFLGSIILKRIHTVSGQIERFSVIDGQQRLTTLTILLKACYDNLDLTELPEEIVSETNTKLRMMLYYKENELSTKKEVKILHSRLDSKDFLSVIDGSIKNKLNKIVLDSEEKKDVPATESGILKCYKYFNNRFIGNSDQAAKIWNLLLSKQQKFLVKIDLEPDENEQAIFDSVNSSGVRLTCADTIKNALFQKVMELAGSDEEAQAEVVSLYKNNWEKTFIGDISISKYWATEQRMGRISRDNLELLLHCIALIKGFFDPEKNNMSDLADVYKNYASRLNKAELYAFVEEIAEYGLIYKKYFAVSDATTSFEYSNDVQRLFHILDVCDVSTLHSYILMLLKKHPADEEGKLPQILIDELKNIETMVIRHTLCKASTKNFNKVCALLIAGKTSIQNEMSAKRELVDDKAVNKALCNIPNNKIATLLLFWIELFRRAHDAKFDLTDLKYSYSLEHIMPQSWEENWGIDKIQVVTTDTETPIVDEETAREIRRAAIYEIGNMTILNRKLNSSLSNKTIQEKMDGKGRTKGMRVYASLDVAQEVIKTYDESGRWNEKIIRNRTNKIYEEFLELWPAEFSLFEIDEDMLLYLESNDIKATGNYLKDKRFQVNAGSHFAIAELSSCKTSIKQMRQELIDKGIVKDGVFSVEYIFGSPSTAASCILGSNLNGKILWKNESGVTLKNMYSEIEEESQFALTDAE